jgi:hypothetical protein
MRMENVYTGVTAWNVMQLLLLEMKLCLVCYGLYNLLLTPEIVNIHRPLPSKVQVLRLSWQKFLGSMTTESESLKTLRHHLAFFCHLNGLRGVGITWRHFQ